MTETHNPITPIASCYVHRDGRFLMQLHAKEGVWFPPGGKIDTKANELPYEAAARETLEETGISVFLPDPTVMDGNTVDLPLPVAMQTETYMGKDGVERVYLNHVFVAECPEGAEYSGNQESLDHGWFTPAEMMLLPKFPLAIQKRAASMLVFVETMKSAGMWPYNRPKTLLEVFAEQTVPYQPLPEGGLGRIASNILKSVGEESDEFEIPRAWTEGGEHRLDIDRISQTFHVPSEMIRSDEETKNFIGATEHVVPMTFKDRA
jgi:8-oxo-dGTP pyrophosphatase MutT (NUDIX family)